MIQRLLRWLFGESTLYEESRLMRVRWLCRNLPLIEERNESSCIVRWRNP